jgi:hypothetical protein
MLQRVRLGSDNISVIKSIREDEKSPYGQIIKEIKARATTFVSVEFVHEKRDANVHAHSS